MTAETTVLKALYSAINKNDTPAALKLCHPEIVRVEPEDFPSAGTYRGLAEMEAHLSQGGRSNWAEGSCEPEKFEKIGDKIVVFVHVLVRLKNKTEWIDARIADVYAFKDGKIIEMRTFAEAEKAVEWARSQFQE